MNGIDENFHINNVSKSDSVFIYSIDGNRKTGLQHDLPSIEFSNIYILILIILDLKALSQMKLVHLKYCKINQAIQIIS